MILFDFAYVAESAKIEKCIISHIDDVNMCKNSSKMVFFEVFQLWADFDGNLVID